MEKLAKIVRIGGLIAMIGGLATIAVTEFDKKWEQAKERKKPAPAYARQSGENLRIGNWNLEIYGKKKADNPEVIKKYADVVDDHDIMFIQEIRDKSDTAFKRLCSELPKYDCFASSRAGRTNSKEQYGVIYKKGIGIEKVVDYNPDPQDRWERPPLAVTFIKGNYKFTAYNLHAKPNDVQRELSHLEKLVENEGNVMIIGDLNADCSYLNEKTMNVFKSWFWAIDNLQDTTTGPTNCTYDRILLNQDMRKEFAARKVHTKDITPKESDHYPVWTEITPFDK
ncbi:MAG TPA: endonuclease/exonuclease/phosphatase family protein [Candidatus Nanoarchaeia archaeon]|nr:endonuclease/exonuclease/phosphatase family protein [Candidatus Nanoarchaeia archaeon]